MGMGERGQLLRFLMGYEGGRLCLVPGVQAVGRVETGIRDDACTTSRRDVIKGGFSERGVAVEGRGGSCISREI